jgi:hypothetical protein
MPCQAWAKIFFLGGPVSRLWSALIICPLKSQINVNKNWQPDFPFNAHCFPLSIIHRKRETGNGERLNVNAMEKIVIVFALVSVLGRYRQKATDSVTMSRASRGRIAWKRVCSFASHKSEQGGVE